MRKLFPMYCGLDAIAGFHEERERGERLLRAHLPQQAGIVLLEVEDPDWVYGQTTFRYQPEHEKPLKFLERFATLTSNRALPTLASAGAPAAILFVDAALKDRFEKHRAFAEVRHLFRLAADFRVPTKRSSLFGRIKNWFPQSPAVAPESPTDTAQVARDSVHLHVERARTHEDLVEVLMSGLMLYQVCAIDNFVAALEERVNAAPDDAVGRTALAMLLTDLGDHAAGLEQARAATELADAPGEAFLWHAKAAWWGNVADEGLAALNEIRTVPEAWPPSIRSALHALRGALLADLGETELAISALRAAIDIEGGAAGLHLHLAELLGKEGQDEEAVAALRNAVVIRPNCAMVRAELARALERLGDESALARTLRKLAESEAGRIEARRFAASAGIAGIEAPLPDVFAAFDATRRSAIAGTTLPTWLVLLEHSSVFAFANLVLLDEHRAADDYAKGLAPALKLLHGDPLDANGHAALAAVWHLTGRHVLALPWARNATAFKIGEKKLHMLLVDSLAAAGEDAEAFNAADFAVTLQLAEPKVGQTFTNLMWSIPRIDVMLGMAELPNGRAMLRAQAEERLARPELRAAALAGLSLAILPDNGERALVLQREAIALRPDEDIYHNLLLLTLRELGKTDQLPEALAARGAALCRRLPDVTAEQFADAAEESIANGEDHAAQQFVAAGLHLAPALPRLCVLQARLAQAG